MADNLLRRRRVPVVGATGELPVGRLRMTERDRAPRLDDVPHLLDAHSPYTAIAKRDVDLPARRDNAAAHIVLTMEGTPTGRGWPVLDWTIPAEARQRTGVP